MVSRLPHAPRSTITVLQTGTRNGSNYLILSVGINYSHGTEGKDVYKGEDLFCVLLEYSKLISGRTIHSFNFKTLCPKHPNMPFSLQYLNVYKNLWAQTYFACSSEALKISHRHSLFSYNFQYIQDRWRPGDIRTTNTPFPHFLRTFQHPSVHFQYPPRVGPQKDSAN